MTDFAAVTLLLGAHVLGHAAHAAGLRRFLPGLAAAGGDLPYSALVLRRLIAPA